jgi:hypothetical protein
MTENLAEFCDGHSVESRDELVRVRCHVGLTEDLIEGGVYVLGHDPDQIALFGRLAGGLGDFDEEIGDEFVDTIEGVGSGLVAARVFEDELLELTRF